MDFSCWNFEFSLVVRSFVTHPLAYQKENSPLWQKNNLTEIQLCYPGDYGSHNRFVSLIWGRNGEVEESQCNNEKESVFQSSYPFQQLY